MRRLEPTDGPSSAGPVAVPLHRRADALLPLSLLVACMGAQNAIAATLLPSVFSGLGATGQFSANLHAFFLGANLVGVVVGGVLGQRHPPSRVLIWGVVVLVAGSGLVAVAGSTWPILLGRGAQGLGGGIAIVVVYVAIGSGFPAPQRPGALAAVTTGWVVATIVGPVLAATLAEATSWRAVYVVLTVVIAAAGTLTCVRLWDVRPPATGESARAILLVLVPAAAVLMIGLELGDGVISVALLVGLAVVVATSLRPLLPAGTYRLRAGVAAAIGLRGILMGAFAATELWLPFVLVEVRDVGTVAAGAWLSLGAAAGRPARSPTRGASARASPGRAAYVPRAPARSCWPSGRSASASCSSPAFPYRCRSCSGSWRRTASASPWCRWAPASTRSRPSSATP